MTTLILGAVRPPRWALAEKFTFDCISAPVPSRGEKLIRAEAGAQTDLTQPAQTLFIPTAILILFHQQHPPFLQLEAKLSVGQKPGCSRKKREFESQEIDRLARPYLAADLPQP
jgi:hypothetical protein